jgi:hypothetical protein
MGSGATCPCLGTLDSIMDGLSVNVFSFDWSLISIAGKLVFPIS